MNSSPKITLLLGEPLSSPPELNAQVPLQSHVVSSSILDEETLHPSVQSWVCNVCGYSNVPHLSTCALCGVSQEASQRSSPLPTSRPSSTPIPSSTTSTPLVINVHNKSNGIACPICTFINHPSMTRCEMCDSPLENLANLALKSVNERFDKQTPQSEPVSNQQLNFVRLSFRKGGVTVFYSTLKTVILAKEWVKKVSGNEVTVNGRGGIRTSFFISLALKC